MQSRLQKQLRDAEKTVEQIDAENARLRRENAELRKAQAKHAEPEAPGGDPDANYKSQKTWLGKSPAPPAGKTPEDKGADVLL